MIARTAIALFLLANAAAAAAQDTAIDEAAGMKALEAAVPQQSWYPDGYYDVRIAAEAEVAEMPSPPAPGGAVNLITCTRTKPGLGASDPLLQRYGDIALETARLRAEFGQLRYPASLYTEPLLAFEREGIAAAEGKDASSAPYSALADAIEAERMRVAPDLPEVFAFNECVPPPGAAPPPPPPPAPSSTPKPSAPRPSAAIPRRAPGVTVTTQPPAGEVLMISAFAFKVCVRKQPDPWDRFACRWNEVQTGVAKPISGRFVYQVTWPDGTVRKGTREVAPGPTGSATVIFRKVGS